MYQTMGPVRKHGVAVSAKPVGVRDAAIAGCQKPLAVTPRKLPMCLADSHSAVQAFRLAVLVRGAGSVAQTRVAKKLKKEGAGGKRNTTKRRLAKLPAGHGLSSAGRCCTRARTVVPEPSRRVNSALCSHRTEIRQLRRGRSSQSW